jgi:hypothetical protein
MQDDPFKEASKYNTLLRRERNRHEAAVHREICNHEVRLMDLLGALSPAARRVVDAAEQQEPAVTCEVRSLQTPGIVVKHDGTGAYTIETEPTISPSLLTPVPDLAPGALVEVADKPKARARG